MVADRAAERRAAGGGAPACRRGGGDRLRADICQTRGTVFDTINYTTTGALGDWFDSSVGLGADGIDNEMSFSHIDKNIVFDPHTEQLRGREQGADLRAPGGAGGAGGWDLRRAGAEGYVPNARLNVRRSGRSGPPPHTVPQEDVVGQTATVGADGSIVFPFEVKRTKARGKKEPGIYNGGMRGYHQPEPPGHRDRLATLKVQCRGCDHRGRDRPWTSG